MAASFNLEHVMSGIKIVCYELFRTVLSKIPGQLFSSNLKAT